MTQKHILLETIKAFKQGLFNNHKEMVHEANLVMEDFKDVETTEDLKEALDFMKKISKGKYRTFESIQKNSKKVLNNYHKTDI